MNRKKIKQIIAAALAVNFYFFNSSSAIKAFADTITTTPSEAYQEYLLSSTKLQPQDYLEAPTSTNDLDETNTSNGSESEFEFKLFIQKDSSNGLYKDINFQPSNGKFKITLPEDSLLNKTVLTINPKKNISVLTLVTEAGEKTTYENLEQGKSYKLKDYSASNPNLSYALISFEDDTSTTFKYSFNTIIDGNGPTIKNVTKKYIYKDSKLFVDISWTEEDIENNLEDDVTFKKVFLNNQAYNPFKSTNGSYSCEIPLDNITSATDAIIYSCDSLFQPSNNSVTVNPISNFDLSGSYTIGKNDLTVGRYTLYFPFNLNTNVSDINVIVNNSNAYLLSPTHASSALTLTNDYNNKIDFQINFKDSKDSLTVSKYYYLDSKDLILDNSISTLKKSYDSGTNVGTNISSDSILYYDGTTLGLNKTTFPLMINAPKNKTFKTLTVKVNDKEVPFDLKNSHNTVELMDNATNNISIEATDTSGYSTSFSFDVVTEESTNLSVTLPDDNVDAKLTKNTQGSPTDYTLNGTKGNLNITLDNKSLPFDTNSVKIIGKNNAGVIQDISSNIKWNTDSISLVNLNYPVSFVDLEYIDRDNRLVHCSIKTDVSSAPEITSDIPNLFNLSKDYNLKVQDETLPGENKSNIKTTQTTSKDEFTNSNQTKTIYYYLENNDVANLSPITVNDLNNDTLLLNTSDFFKSLTENREYTLHMKYVNSLGISSEEKVITFSVDNSAPTMVDNSANYSHQEVIDGNNVFLFKDALNIPITFNQNPTNTDGSTFEISLNDKNISEYSYSYTKLSKHPSNNETVTKSKITSPSNIYIDEPGVYRISVSAKDAAGNVVENIASFDAAVVKSPKVSLGYMDSNDKFIELSSKTNYVKKSIKPVLRIEGVVSGDALKKVDIKDDKSGNVTYTRKNFSFTGYSFSDYAVSYFTLDSTLDSGHYTYDIDGFNSFLVPFYESTSLVVEDPSNISSSISVNNLPTEDNNGLLLNFVNTINSIDFSVDNIFSSLDKDPSFKIKNKDTNEDVTDNFRLVKKGSGDYSYNYSLVLKDDADKSQLTGLLAGVFDYNTNAGNNITKNFSFVYDITSPTFTMNFVNNTNGDSVSNPSNPSSIPGTGGLYWSAAGDSTKIYTSWKNFKVNVKFDDNSIKYNYWTGTNLGKTISNTVKISNESKDVYSSSSTDNDFSILSSSVFNDSSSSINSGLYKIHIESEDTAGNKISKEIPLMLDFASPEISFNNDISGNTANDKTYFSKSLTPKVTVSDTLLPNNYTVLYRITNLNAPDENSDFKRAESTANNVVSLDDLSKDGVYRVEAKAIDYAGNESTLLNEVYVIDTNKPEGKITNSPDSNDINSYYIKNNEIYFKVTDINLDINNFKNNLKILYLNKVSDNPFTDISKNGELVSNPKNITLVSENDGVYVFKTSLKGNGYYSISSNIVDFAGNEALLSGNKDFIVDNSNMNLSFAGFDGFTPNMYTNKNVKFQVNIPGHISGYKSAKFTLTKDGVDKSNYISYALNNGKNFSKALSTVPSTGGVVSVNMDINSAEEGHYIFSYTVVDNYGNENSNSIPYVIDKTSPSLSINSLNLGDGKNVNDIYYTNSKDVSFKFDMADKYTSTEELNKKLVIDGNSYSLQDLTIPNNALASQGMHNITLTLTDKAGNTTSKSYQLVMDTVAPSISVSGFNGHVDAGDGMLYINKNINVSINVTDAEGEDIAKRITTLDLHTYNSPDITSDGTHTYGVKVFDYAGNVSTYEKTFVLDKVSPEISYSGVEKDKYYNHSVAATYTVNDPSAVLNAYLNSSSYSGEVISKDGSYELLLVAVDKALNRTEIRIPFIIDTIAPIITIGGIKPDELNGGILSPIITTDDANAVLFILLNGEEYYGDSITESGKYTLIVKAVDKAGNLAKKLVSFTLDSTLPQISIQGIENGKSYTSGVKPRIFATKNAKISMLLNGKPYNGEEITEVGDYTMEITATDNLSNTNKAIYKFSIASPKVAKTNESSNSVIGSISEKIADNPILVALIAAIAIIVPGGFATLRHLKRNKDNHTDHNE